MPVTNIPKDTLNWDVPVNANFAALQAEKSDTTHTHTQSQSHGAADTDSATTALHHTLGTGANQAAAGNHTHTQAQSHASPDTDLAPSSLHHTLGSGANQAAAGNHSHSYAAVTHASSHITGGSDIIPTVSTSASGLAPASGGGTTNFLRADGTWAAPSSAGLFSSVANGIVPASGGGTVNYLRADGTWSTPAGGGGGSTTFGAQYIDVKADYGAAGDALPINITITSGSAAATLTSGTIPSTGFSGKRVVIAGAGAGGVPLVTTISARTDSTHITLANTASTSVTGATAYWGTDDTTAFTTARDAWIAGAVAYSSGPNGDRLLQKALFIPAGKYIITGEDALLNSPTGGTAAVLRNGLIQGSVGTEGTEIIFATNLSVATTTADPSRGNLITAANRMHGWTIRNLKLRSLNSAQGFAYLWCSVTNDGTQYPNFGSGSQRRIVWEGLDFRGDWDFGIALDGDSAANLNSEQVFRHFYANDSCTFADALFHSGLTNPAGNAQQDQFVNYIIEDCILEFNQGSAWKFDRGGHITCIGGSFVGGVQGGSVIFFDLSRGGGNYWKAHLEVIGTRFECRTSGSRVLYSEWRDQICHVAFNNCAMSANAVAGDETNMPFIEIYNASGTSVGQGSYRFVNCEIPGYVKFTGSSTQSFGRIVFDQCNFTHNWSGLSTEAAATGAIRYAGSFAPKYRFRDCWNITDAAN